MPRATGTELEDGSSGRTIRTDKTPDIKKLLLLFVFILVVAFIMTRERRELEQTEER